MNRLFIIILIVLLGLLMFDNYILRKKLDIVEGGLHRLNLDKIDFDKLFNQVADLDNSLKENGEADEEFRKNQTEFDGKIIRVFKERGLVQ